jgi:hypothetical protein
MTLKEFISNLNKLVADRPELGEATVIYSRDDEGNGYQEIDTKPSVAYYDEKSSYWIESVYSEHDLEDDELADVESFIEAVVIN